MSEEEERRDNVPFLDTDPPSWSVRGLAILLIALFIAAGLATTLVRVPETVTAKFVLIDIKGRDPIQAPVDAHVAEALVSEGGAVSRGDRLFVIRSREITDRASELGTLEQEATGGRGRLSSVRVRGESQRLADLEEERLLAGRIEALERMIAVKSGEFEVARDVLARADTLRTEGVGSPRDADDRKIEVARIEVDLQNMERDLGEARSSLRQARHQSRANEADAMLAAQSIEEKLESGSLRSSSLRRELVASEGDSLVLLSPCDGTVVRLFARSRGAVVLEGEPLAEISCTGEPLEAELTLDQSIAAKVEPGQDVKLLYDSFPYQRYGVRFGTVRWVSPSAVRNGDVIVFPARVAVSAQTIEINGRDRPLLRGMEGSARIITERRTLIDYAFAPIRELRETLRSSEQ